MTSVTDQRVSAAIRQVLADMTKRYTVTPPTDQAMFWGREWELEDDLLVKLSRRPLTIQEIKAACLTFLKRVFE